MQPADERDDDRREAVARREHRQQLPDRSRDFADAGDARARAADQHRQPDRALRRNARVVGGRAAPGPRRASGSRRGSCCMNTPAGGDGRQRDEEADVEARPSAAGGSSAASCEQLRLRKVEALRIAPRHRARATTAASVRDVDEHQRDQDLVGVEARAQEGGDRAPTAMPPSAAGDDHRRQHAARLACSSNASAMPPPAIAPMMSWPSAPMFQTLAR